jgi:hypothetical protein
MGLPGKEAYPERPAADPQVERPHHEETEFEPVRVVSGHLNLLKRNIKHYPGNLNAGIWKIMRILLFPNRFR